MAAAQSGANIHIRELEPGDRQAWLRLWQAYLEFYAASLPAEVTAATWARLQDPAEPIFALGAFIEGELVGITHFLFHRSTWTVGDYCYLQDLYTAEHARGQGVGRALIQAVYSRASDAGAARVYWVTHEGNAAARALYDKVAIYSGFIHYRMPVEP